MKILILSQLYPPDMGGGATRAHNIALGLKKAGCDIFVVCAAPHYPTGNIPRRYRWKPIRIDYRDGIPVIRTMVPPLESLGFIRRVILFLSFIISSLFAFPLVGRVGAVFASNPNVFATFPGIFYSKLSRCPLIQNVDDLWPEVLYDLGMSKDTCIGKIGEALASMTFHLASAITPISPAYVPTIIKKYKINQSKIHILPAGVDLSRFSQTDLKQKKKSRVFRVLYIGAFSPTYNFNQIFEAAEILSDNEDIEFIIQGGGELADVLINKARQLNLSNISVVDKIVDRKEVADYLFQADALILPLSGIGSIEQGISSKLYEYQAAGKPILCCSSGEPGRYVSSSNSGIVITPGDSLDLARKIIFLKENPAIAADMGKRGRKYVEDTQSLDIIGKKMLQLIDAATLGE